MCEIVHCVHARTYEIQPCWQCLETALFITPDKTDVLVADVGVFSITIILLQGKL